MEPSLTTELVSRAAEFGIVAVSFVFMLRWTITRLESELQAIRESMAVAADRAERSNNHLSRSIAAQSLVLLSMQKHLLSHDLTATGLEQGEPHSDKRIEAVMRTYGELRVILEECERRLTELGKSNN